MGNISKRHERWNMTSLSTRSDHRARARSARALGLSKEGDRLPSGFTSQAQSQTETIQRFIRDFIKCLAYRSCFLSARGEVPLVSRKTRAM